MLGSLGLAQPAVYVVQPGDTLTEIAQSFGVSAAELAAANDLADPNRLAVGQQLRVPLVQSWDAPLPDPFKAISLSPRDATQGQVQTLTVILDPPGVPVKVSYLGAVVPVLPTGDGFEALLATPVLAAAGSYTMLLHVESGGDDDDADDADIALPVKVLDGGYDREQIKLSAETSQLLAPAIVNREHALLEDTCAAFDPVKRWQGAFRYPVDEPEFTSVFGTLRSYNGGPYSGFHRGQDFRGSVGTPAYAAAAGVVSLSDTLELYGNTVILNHGLGVCSAYMHLSERLVSQGQTLKEGDLLGRVGATGLVTGPHLHWEVRVGGVPVAPLQWTGGN